MMRLTIDQGVHALNRNHKACPVAPRLVAARAPFSSTARREPGRREPHRHLVYAVAYDKTDATATTPAASAPPVASLSRDCAGALQHRGPPLTHAQLLDVAHKFVGHWFSGISGGPSEAVLTQLNNLLVPDVIVEADGVRRLERAQGISEVLAELERSHLEYPRSEHRPLLFAASEEGQRSYALVEGRYQDVGALPGHPATFRVTTVYHIFVLEAGRGAAAAAGAPGGSAAAGGERSGPCVTRLWLLRQLTEEDKDELLHDPVHCYAAPFPKELLTLAGSEDRDRSAGKLQRTMRRWWESWSSHNLAPFDGAANGGGANGASIDPQSAASAASSPGELKVPQGPFGSGASVASASFDGAGRAGSRAAAAARRAADAAVEAAAMRLMDPDFRLFDAYGLWRSMQAAPHEGPGSGSRGSRGGRRGMGRDAALFYMQRLKRLYGEVRVEVQDVAVAENSLACFTHWRACFAPPAALADSTGDEVPEDASQGAAPAGPAARAASARVAGALPRVQQRAHELEEQQQPDGQQQPEDALAAARKAAADAAAAAAAAAARAASPFRPEPFEVEGVEVDVFSEQLLLQGIWLFRGALDMERPLFLEQERREKAAQHASEVAAQEALRADRRLQREQQLQELLAWAQAGQQHFESYVTHVKRQIQRQRQLLGRIGGSASDSSDGDSS